ncbi:MAG: DpnII family type II restriction endonuclease [Candidatus Njordarchaeales archaeon]
MRKVTVEEILSQIERIPSEWLNEIGRKVIDTIPKVVEELRSNKINEDLIKEILEKYEYALDVFRLMLGISQDEMANELLYFSKIEFGKDFKSIRRKARQHSLELAKALIRDLGLADVINRELFHEWKYFEILIERYKYQRGRAIKGQKRGKSLEDDVEEILKKAEIVYEKGGNFISRRGLEAKADFSIPSRFHPRVVIEVKGYEATGSKLTDVLGDILKITQAKDREMKFYLVTDGIGWFRRKSDLEKIVKLQNNGFIDMIYTRKTLPNLRAELLKIL